MDTLELGKTMVEMVTQGREGEASFVSQYYAGDIVSVEGGDSDDMPATIEGIEAIKGKHAWWYDNNEVHGTIATGPFIGNREDTFVLHYSMDITPKDGERMTMNEVAIYAVKDGKIAHEEYLYQM